MPTYRVVYPRTPFFTHRPCGCCFANSMALRRQLASSLRGGWKSMRPASGSSVPLRAPLPSGSSRRAAVASNVTAKTFRRVISSTAVSRDKVNLTFIEDDGTEVKVEAECGATLLEVAHDNDIDLEGACGGDLACSTCHVVLPKEFYDKLGEKQEEEDDMLDLAWGLTDTSRLGCQIKVSAELEGMVVKIPEDTIDMR